MWMHCPKIDRLLVVRWHTVVATRFSSTLCTISSRALVSSASFFLRTLIFSFRDLVLEGKHLTLSGRLSHMLLNYINAFSIKTCILAYTWPTKLLKSIINRLNSLVPRLTHTNPLVRVSLGTRLGDCHMNNEFIILSHGQLAILAHETKVYMYACVHIY